MITYLSLLMLCCMTVAWAGTGDGSKEHPYTGDWQASELIPKLKEGNHLAYDCVIKCNSGCGLFVYDDKVNNADIIKNWSEWGVGYAITENEPLRVYYEDYYSLNSPEDRKSHTFIVTNVDNSASNRINITGHYSGHYDRGDGTKENPYCGEWQVSELRPKLKKGVYLAFDCVIKDGKITVFDNILKKQVAINWTPWAPGNLIGDPQPNSDYYQYGQDNSAANRRGQSFIVTYVRPIDQDQTELAINGYFSGFYRTTDPDGFYHVYTAKQMETVLNGNAHAKVRLTGDIYLSDKSNDNTFCSTFYGTIDGDGYTINGSKDGTRQNRNYLFTYSDGATFKNLTFKQIRKNSADHSNQAIITSQAKNHCVFENITFENVGTFSNYDNAGTAAGYATDCTFTDITVRNSDCTVDGDQSGCVAGHAIGCTFTNIKVENCESTADDEKAGGVVGRADNCTFSHVEILGTFIQTDGRFAGGVAGYSENSNYTNCTTDDQSCVFTDQNECGGIIGHATACTIKECTNYALIGSARFDLDLYNQIDAGGIVGVVRENDDKKITTIESCINAGLLFNASLTNFKSIAEKYQKHAYKQSAINYAGKTFIIQELDEDTIDDKLKKGKYGGGIVGDGVSCKITNCANLAPMYLNRFAGGIAARLFNSSIECCANYGNNVAESGQEECGAILGDCHNETSINNCLNVGSSYLCLVGRIYDTDCSVKNSLNIVGEYTTQSVPGTIALPLDYIKVNYYDKNNTNPKMLASGDICKKLGAAWEQNLGTDAYPTPTGNKGLYHTRKVSNEYGTVCLPFPVKSDDKISYYSLSEKEEDEQGIKLVFQYDEEVSAGFPALFRSSEATDATADNPVEICFNNAGNDFAHSNYGNIGGYWELWGTFEQKVFDETTDVSPKNIYYVSGGEIRNAKKITIAPYRAYIYGESIDKLRDPSTSEAKAIRFVIEDEDGETTALQFVGDDLMPLQQGAKTYSLMGTEVDENYHGIVIKNGKKYLKK